MSTYPTPVKIAAGPLYDALRLQTVITIEARGMFGCQCHESHAEFAAPNGQRAQGRPHRPQDGGWTVSPVWSIPAYHTDEDAWRERIEAKRAANHALLAAEQAAKESQRNPRKVKPAPVREPRERRKPAPVREPRERRKPGPPRRAGIQPCPTCGRPTRPSSYSVTEYPGTIKRTGSGKCHKCEAGLTRTERTCKSYGCSNVIPADANPRQLYCTDKCRRTDSEPKPRTEVQCRRCGQTFHRELRQRREYCSNRCVNAMKADKKREKWQPVEPQTVACAHCGTEFQRGHRAPQLYCCNRCRWAAQRARDRLERAA